jgi:hypothetical protein
MRAKYAVLGAATIAAFSTGTFSTDTSATSCLATATAAYDSMVGIGTAGLCTVNNHAITIFIESKPTTTIYNFVDNSINYLHTSGIAGATISTFIDNTPTTIIYNLVDNSVTFNGLVNAPINIFIESTPTTIIYNIVDNSVNYVQAYDPVSTMISNLIESRPITLIYNLIDNSVNYNVISANLQDDLASAPEPTSLALLGVGLGALSLVRIKRCKR